MKKIISVIILLCVSILLSSCDFGDYHITDPDKYNPKDGNMTVYYFPESIDKYTVNSYSYNTYRYLDTCTEIFLDISVSEEQFKHIIETAKKFDNVVEIKQAFYDKEYTEIVLSDYYSESDKNDEGKLWVDNAEIKKIIYNEDNRNIVFEYFYAVDSNVYPLDEVIYFKRFNISESDYILHSESYYIDDSTQKESNIGFSNT